LIRLLVTNAETRKSEWDWRNRSVLLWVTRISRFIASGWQTILLDFQQDFGDGLPDEDTRTVKLEETTAPGKTFSSG